MNDNEHLKVFLNPLAFVPAMEGSSGGAPPEPPASSVRSGDPGRNSTSFFCALPCLGARRPWSARGGGRWRTARHGPPERPASAHRQGGRIHENANPTLPATPFLRSNLVRKRRGPRWRDRPVRDRPGTRRTT